MRSYALEISKHAERIDQESFQKEISLLCAVGRRECPCLSTASPAMSAPFDNGTIFIYQYSTD